MMKHSLEASQWYAGSSSSDKYVSCIVAKIDDFRRQGVSISLDWLKRVSQLPVKDSWSLRRRFWIFTLQLRYAEWKQNESKAKNILEESKRVINTEEDLYTQQMYKVLEADCNIALYKITTGRIHPLFKNYHSSLLLIADDFLMLDQRSFPHKAFVEDCNRIFDVSSDIEKERASELYKSVKPYKPKINLPSICTDTNTKENIIIFKRTNNGDTDNILPYLTQWLGEEFFSNSYYSLGNLLTYVESARKYVVNNLGVNPENLFAIDIQTDICLQEKVQEARKCMVDELTSRKIPHDKSSFWKLYIEVVFQKSLDFMGEKKYIYTSDLVALKQAARWPLHEKMHNVIHALTSDPDYLQNLLNKNIIHSESLLYGLFAQLAMKLVPVVYCGFNIVDIEDVNSPLQRNCYNGKGLERIYNELVLHIYKITRQHIGKGFCITFDDNIGMNLIKDFGCVCTGTQVVMVGISRDFDFENFHYLSGREVLGELFKLVGFEFSEHEVINLSGPKTPETSVIKLKQASLIPLDINIRSGFANKLIGRNTISNNMEDFNLEQKFFTTGLFDEIIETVRGSNLNLLTH